MSDELRKIHERLNTQTKTQVILAKTLIALAVIQLITTIIKFAL